jgi:uncharacterized protein
MLPGEGGERMHYLLFYEVGDDYLARREEFRQAQLEKAWKASERGELALGGALGEPVDGAVLLFTGDSPAVAENFAQADPYVTGGLVKRWYVRQWNTVAGEGAATPIRPKAVSTSKRDPSAEAADTHSSAEKLSQHRPSILRLWTARTTLDKFDGYVQHLSRNVFPALAAIRGHRGAYLLRRENGGAVEIVVLTLWDSMDAVRKFTCGDPSKAVVEPPARAVLTAFDEFVKHYEVVFSSARTV